MHTLLENGMMRVNCSDKQIMWLLWIPKGCCAKKAENKEKNLNVKQRKISGRVTPGIVCAAWIYKIEMSSSGICVQLRGIKTTINRREKVRRKKVKNAFLIVRFPNKAKNKWNDFERVKLEDSMWKNCVCPEIRLTTACPKKSEANTSMNLTPRKSWTFALFESESNWVIAISFFQQIGKWKEISSVLQNYLFLVINTRNLQLQICSLSFFRRSSAEKYLI